ncbi:FixH family protein [Roseibium sediminicola]|uniref:FixH family protein n=1 Tax=Roseibium sediminicola TaxID=2933272 RepID=A0ABT0GP37_9HYPH|nr:FixH family protein [Roseibium sp. CAU 1639]MCK7611010.1 FixH family protein [Roseibium sp. CAU 1639]
MTMVQSNMKDPKAITGKTVLAWLLGFFGVVFAANAVFIYLALGSFPGVVVESSYEAGQAYNQEIAAAKLQADLNWQVSSELVRSDAETGKLVVTAKDAAGEPLYGIELNAMLRNPVHDGADLRVTFHADGGGRYVGDVDNLAPGNWTLVLLISKDGERKFKSENRIFVKE